MQIYDHIGDASTTSFIEWITFRKVICTLKKMFALPIFELTWVAPCYVPFVSKTISLICELATELLVAALKFITFRIIFFLLQVSVLVSNAGRSQRAAWDDIEMEVDKSLFELNVFSLVSLSRVVNKHFREVVMMKLFSCYNLATSSI